MKFRISGLPVEPFRELLQMDDAALAEAGVQRCIVDAPHAYPCRVTLEDAVPGEEVLLLPYAHHAVDNPYTSAGPIFVRRSAVATRVVENQVPEQQRRRLLSVRAYDAHGWMLDAEVTEGAELESLIRRLFDNPDVAYLHAHNARRGCYSCRIDRLD